MAKCFFHGLDLQGVFIHSLASIFMYGTCILLYSECVCGFCLSSVVPIYSSPSVSFYPKVSSFNLKTSPKFNFFCIIHLHFKYTYIYDIKWCSIQKLDVFFSFFFSLTGGNVSKLLEFSKDLQELLQMQVEFKLPLSSLISEYQSWFDKKTPFDPAAYGFTSVVTLLEALPAVAEVSKFVLYSDPLTPKSD